MTIESQQDPMTWMEIFPAKIVESMMVPISKSALLSWEMASFQMLGKSKPIDRMISRLFHLSKSWSNKIPRTNNEIFVTAKVSICII